MLRAAAARIRTPTPHQTERRAAVSLLRSLGLASRFSLDDLRRAVERRRGAAIRLVAWSMPPAGPSGMWVSGAHAEYVFYPARASTLARVVIIGHELGHIARNDTATPGELVQLSAALTPHVDPGVILAPPARSPYDADTERRAEVFGTVVAECVGSWSAAGATSRDRALLQQLSTSMEAVNVHG